ncbi:MAG: aspartate aminotransferase family protein [Planctomycetes bacterium]|nr:aspartate aminotransferase family protein [Planctomycetota bacterium]
MAVTDVGGYAGAGKEFGVSDFDSDSLRARDQSYLLHPLHDKAAQASGRIWVEGEGAVLRDADGKAYIDALAGLWNVLVGHGRRELADAAARQMEKLAFVSGYAGHTNRPAIELAERLGGLCYPNVQMFFFTCGGADSNETAFKTARFYWKSVGQPSKTKIISRRWAYHGTTLATMSATGMDWYWPMFEPRVPGFLHIESPYPYWFETVMSPSVPGGDSAGNSPLPSGGEGPGVRGQSAGVAAADLLEEAILREGPDTVAAFIAEPVQGAGGVIVPPADYFPRIRQICDRYDVLLIADEVITGFGRTGRWFALEHWGVRPDIITFAKGITSGYIPLGGMGVSRQIADAIRSGTGPAKWMHAYTYSGHPTACAVALANLDIIEREGLVGRAAAMGQRLVNGLKRLERLPHVGETRGLGLMAAVELVESKQPKKRFDPTRGIGARVLAESANRGVVTRTVGDVVLLAPPLVTREDQLDRIIQVVDESIQAATKLVIRASSIDG